MSRSQRRAAVIRRAIAAGLLCAGFGTGALAPAAADSGVDGRGPGPSNHDGSGRGGPPAAPNADAGSGTPSRRGVRTLPAPAPAGDEEWHPPHHWWCHIVWPDWPIAPPLPFTRNRNAFIFYPGPAAQAPVTVLGVASAPHASTALAGAVAEAPAAQDPAAAPPAAAGQSGAAAFSGVQSVPAMPVALPEVPAAPPPDARQPEIVAAVPNPPRTGLPGVPAANLGQIAALALPGLAGIAALTALGGFVGYRQAKAGYVLRAAGTARFLQ